MKFSKQALEYIIENYTRESGVRELEKKINKIMRKIALQFARDGFEKVHEIKPDDVREYLGTPEYTRDKYQGNDYAGVVTGLAWTAVGWRDFIRRNQLEQRERRQTYLDRKLG